MLGSKNQMLTVEHVGEKLLACCTLHSCITPATHGRVRTWHCLLKLNEVVMEIAA